MEFLGWAFHGGWWFLDRTKEPSTSHSMSHSTLLGFMERKVEPLTTPPVGSPGRNVSSGRPVDASGLVVGTTQKMVIRLRGTIQ